MYYKDSAIYMESKVGKENVISYFSGLIDVAVFFFKYVFYGLQFALLRS